MNFKEAYKEIMGGKRVCKDDLSVSSPTGSISVKYLSLVVVDYYEAGRLIKTEPSFIAAFDQNEGINRLSEANLIQMLLSEEDDWKEYVECCSDEEIHENIVDVLKE